MMNQRRTTAMTLVANGTNTTAAEPVLPLLRSSNRQSPPHAARWATSSPGRRKQRRRRTPFEVKTARVALWSCALTAFFFIFFVFLGGNNNNDHDPNKKQQRGERKMSATTTDISSTSVDVNHVKNVNEPPEVLSAHTTVSPLEATDYEGFTVRINTWKRQEQLQFSVKHHLTCPAVRHIQIVWCLEQGDPPDWLLAMEEEEESSSGSAESKVRVVIERHPNNSLNERFLLLSEPPTAAVLSIDDDVIRPCVALQAAFFKWARNPDRQVGFDARSHVVANGGGWQYGYMSTTERTNAYSLTLTRCSFLHRDYLRRYETDVPAAVRDAVEQSFNCEDIAMSLWITAQTGGRPPLLADYWAVKSQIKLYVDSKISAGGHHKSLRDDCVKNFADLFGLKDELVTAALRHDTPFEYGTAADNWNPLPAPTLQWQRDTLATVQRWKEQQQQVMVDELMELRAQASHAAYEAGLIEKSEPWKERFHPENPKEEHQPSVK